MRPASQQHISQNQINQLRQRPLSQAKQAKSTTLKISSSNKNFPQSGLIRAQNTELLRKQKKSDICPTEFKKVLIHEVNELKQRMKDHFRHISNLSPDKCTHSRSGSRSRSRKSRSPKITKARIPRPKN